jgi:hypothetical protein
MSDIERQLRSAPLPKAGPELRDRVLRTVSDELQSQASGRIDRILLYTAAASLLVAASLVGLTSKANATRWPQLVGTPPIPEPIAQIVADARRMGVQDTTGLERWLAAATRGRNSSAAAGRHHREILQQWSHE